ncbi:unnamed protein product [Rhizoctonia solani]|uniref:BTB domain-containing protein n=1 Tax=Rhizoctonia solani TaxID=456999 RepID=A0A8H3D1Y3_9AGAM|nr:unnamed protein product [Rhizoctonia solani]CAE6506065.1 unnamed protein product [Rhizoctonia solani]
MSNQNTMRAGSNPDLEVKLQESILSDGEGKLTITSRDPDFYFEDGSITFCIEGVLFKVHSTLLKLRPSDFEGRFDTSPECVNSTRGTCDDIPLHIPNIKASQFRNLMKVIYCPPSNKFFLSLPTVTSADIEEQDAWRKFIFYLDVASLAHQFGMHGVEKWAKPRLQSLTHTAARKISSGLGSTTSDDRLELGFTTDESEENINVGNDPEDATYELEEDAGSLEESDDGGEDNDEDTGEDEGDKCAKGEDGAEERGCESGGGRSDDDGSDDDSNEDKDYSDSDQPSTDDGSDDDDTNGGSGELVRAEDSPIFRFIDGIWYAKDISDTFLLQDIRNILQYHCASLPVDLLLGLFRAPNLREKDPSMFGFLFLLLLEHGHETWNRKVFTHLDRMAFFSTQCYLTPLPGSLKIPSATPFFDKIKSAKKFARRFSSNLTQTSCVKKCYREAFSFWKAEFDDNYYDNMASSEPLVAIGSLLAIPSQRLGFSEKLHNIKCDHRCYLRLLGRVDRDIQGLYARLAEYYRPIA